MLKYSVEITGLKAKGRCGLVVDNVSVWVAKFGNFGIGGGGENMLLPSLDMNLSVAYAFSTGGKTFEAELRIRSPYRIFP